jgi:hypothetical protein
VIIDRIRPSDADGRAGVECDVRFESGRAGARALFVRTEPPHTLTPDPGGFLVGAFLPAWTAGEKRIRIDGAVCPVLASNLAIAAKTLRRWHKELPSPPVVECDHEYRGPATKSAVFLSGGVDSLAMVRHLTKLRPPGHPDRPVAAIVVDYQHLGGISREETGARLAAGLATARAAGAELGLDVVPLASNLCTLNPNMTFWMLLYHGAYLASMAHFLGHAFRTAHVASSFPATNLIPWGSHPQLDPYYCSQHVRLSHEGIEMTRLRKTETICDWPLALDRLYVCTSDRSGGRNCGRCEKCVRTRVHLLSLGKLAQSAAFRGGDIDPRELLSVRITNEYARLCFAEALPGLERRGRRDLVAASRALIADFDARRKAGNDPSPAIRVVRRP